MRMNQEASLTAYEVVNHYDYHELVRIFSNMERTSFPNRLLEKLNRRVSLNRSRQRLSWQRLSNLPNRQGAQEKRSPSQTNFPSYPYRG